MMKKILLVAGVLSLLFSAGVLLAVPAPAGAVDVVQGVCDNPNQTERPSFCGDNATTAKDSENPIFGPNSVLTKVIHILSFIVAIISIFVIIICALKMMTSMGDPTGVATARGGLIYACVALVIVAMAQVIVRLLLNKLK